MIALNLSERRKIFKTPRNESKIKKGPQSKKNEIRTPENFQNPEKRIENEKRTSIQKK